MQQKSIKYESVDRLHNNRFDKTRCGILNSTPTPLTHLFHEFLIVLIAIHFPVAVEGHGGCEGLWGAGRRCSEECPTQSLPLLL